MIRESLKLLEIARHGNVVKASFNNTLRLNILNAEAMKLELLDVVSRQYTTLEISFANIDFVDSAIIDVLNLISRMARRYHSIVKLVHVNDNLLELINLVKVHSVFDVPYINNHYYSRSVA